MIASRDILNLGC